MNAVGAEHVRDLVRVGDDGGRPERQHEAGELVDEQLHRLEVHVRVDESGDDVASRRVDHLGAVVRTEAGDDAVRDGDVAFEPFPGEHGKDAPTAYYEVCRLIAAGDGKSPFESRHRADDNLFSGNGHLRRSRTRSPGGGA